MTEPVTEREQRFEHLHRAVRATSQTDAAAHQAETHEWETTELADLRA